MTKWIKAMRLRTLPLAFSNILLGTSLAHALYSFDSIIFILTLLTTLALQILSNFANDYGDFSKGTDNNQRLGPLRSVQSGSISAKSMLKAMVITGFLAFILGASLLLYTFQDNLGEGIILFFTLGIAAIAAAVFYTVGKRAYGYHGLGDLFVFIFFGWIGVIGTAYLQMQQLDLNFMLPATTMGCFSVAVLNLNNMRDLENDRNSGKNTLVVKLGLQNAKRYHYGLFAVAYSSFILFVCMREDIHPTLLLFLIPVFLLQCLHLIRVTKIKTAREFDPELKVVALSALLFSVLVYVGLFLI
ncbi:MAG: 1,4-dihydroxy-2-naphthoate octaprenyltransferase [Crocinitomicaceae bacterium]